MTGTGFFGDIAAIRYEGPQGTNALAFRHYDPDRKVLGKRMADHLRPAVCYWHTLAWPGLDMFGGPTFERPWFGDTKDAARLKADVAFELISLLGVPFFTFHDRDVAPEGGNLAEFGRNLNEIADYFARKMESSGVKLLWGTANLFSHRRYMAGAATNPDPDVFAHAAAQVKNAIDVTHRLGGANYVLWGGREGYETLLNTDLRRELDQLGRFLALVVEYKHKIGFSGTILVEPKPQEPTKHQYDYDVATVFGFLQRYGLEKEVKVNIEVGHAVLAGHSFEHEVATAVALGIFGSVDANRNDYQSGWDTDQFPNNAAELVPAFYHLIKSGGFSTGGFNFDAKIRRQSIDPADLLYGHIGGLDVCAQALIAAAALIEDGTYDRFLAARYAGWDTPEAKAMLAGERSLADIAARVEREAIDPKPRSGRQEHLENLLNRFL
ncbi:MAG: xylose isomerase [Methylobacteriaceae bacterium]|nr:xylose isomerase [Methylobacteriaceae bacterium]MBV9243421.1 xylose isomerase [Methylobacteriaceae bacterium]MBV9634463.1 xylose isomerase [Methylobacteriaceae bacterium]